MRLKFEKTLDYFLFFIILIKIIFVGAAVGHLFFSHFYNEKTQLLDHKLLYWKERTEFVFIISMSILLIYQFHPLLSKKHLDDETSLLFFLFGWVLFLTAQWSLFIKEAHWYERIVNSLK
jgi:hypothetical protein